MMSAHLQARLQEAYTAGLVTLSVPMTWNDAGAGVTLVATEGGFRSVGRDDETMINTYGIETKVITLLATALPRPPAQFDQFTVGGVVYVVMAVHTGMIADQPFSHKCYCKGA